MKLRAYLERFSTLSIEGTKDDLAEFGQKLDELRSIPDGYLALKTSPTRDGDMTDIELCMTKRLPVICTKVYRGRLAPLFSELEFPASVRLGCFRCVVSMASCRRLTYALKPEVRRCNEVNYQVSETICEYCGRNVALVSNRKYRFLYSCAHGRSECRTVHFDLSDFRRIARRRMGRDIELAGLCTVRAWRKGSSTVVIEGTEEGIAELKDKYVEPLLSHPESELYHMHFTRLARVSKLDYTELLLRVTNRDQYKRARRISRASYDKYLIVCWATCVNLRCGYRFLAAEDSYDVEEPTSEDYRTILVGNSSCPLCGSAYFISHSAHYVKSE